MSLFGFIKNNKMHDPGTTVQFAKPQIRRVFTVSMPQSHSFKGFRRINLRYADIDGCTETLSRYRSSGFKFKGSEIRIEGFNKISNGESSRFAKVYVDNHIIGVIAEHMYRELSFVFDNKYDKAFLKVEEFYHTDGSIMGANIYLFVHLCNHLSPGIDVSVI